MEDDDEQSKGLPAWMATFADLMALLMCFFVLLLSFSEMDVLKYKQVAGSMANAFGVQNQRTAEGIPMGTSVIAQEFSPGRPEPTLENVIEQQAVPNPFQSLQTGQADNGVDADAVPAQSDSNDAAVAEENLRQRLLELSQETLADAEKLREALAPEIAAGLIDIESGFRSITIRIRERGSFESGSAIVNDAFLPVMARLRTVLRDIEGRIAVEGHTDNIPIATAQSPSNWYLSSQRALFVAHELMGNDGIDDERMMVIGYADTRPFESNATAAGRARNRRVEIITHQPVDAATTAELRELRQLQGFGDDILEVLGIDQAELDAVSQ